MNVRQPLLRRLVVFMAAVVATLSFGAFLITRSVTRSGLEDLFRQRLTRAERVLEQYLKNRRLAQSGELESVLTSPRFLAAVETRDPATLAESVPTHGILLDADIVVILSASGDVLYRSSRVDDTTLAKLVRLAPDPRPVFLATEDGEDLREILVAPLVANNGAQIGRLMLGQGLGSTYLEDLRALTGFDVVVSSAGRVLARTEGMLADVPADALAGLLAAPIGENVQARVAGENVLAHRALDEESNVSVTFVGSVDEAIAPIMSHVSRLLLGMAALSTALAVAVVYFFASRRVGRQVASLARSAERVARGDLDFTIRPESQDELGYVAGEFEKMRAQLRAGREALEKAHADRVNAERLAAVGGMATGIIHDFKNPMAVVLGTADLMKMRDPGNAKLTKQCDVIRAQIERMSALTRDVLEYARGRTVLEPAEIDLAAWLGELVEGHQEPAQRAGLRLALEAAPDLRVIVDPGRMRRVVDNLLTNAREASRVGDTVTISARVRPEGDVWVEVVDQGPGIPKEIAQTLFEPFVTSGKDGGSGLGLAISKKIVEDHGAALTVESEPGKGARFRIALPAKLRAGARSENTSTEREEVEAS